MARSKVVETVLNTLEKVEAAVRAVAAAMVRRTALAAEKDARLDGIRDEFAPELAKLKEAVDRGTKQLRSWALARKEEFEEPRFKVFTHGTIGFQLHPHHVVNAAEGVDEDDFSAAVQALEAMPAEVQQQYLRRTVELKLDEVRAQLLSNGPDAAMLRRLNLGLAQDEQFYIEPKAESVESVTVVG